MRRAWLLALWLVLVALGIGALASGCEGQVLPVEIVGSEGAEGGPDGSGGVDATSMTDTTSLPDDAGQDATTDSGSGMADAKDSGEASADADATIDAREESAVESGLPDSGPADSSVGSVDSGVPDDTGSTFGPDGADAAVDASPDASLDGPPEESVTVGGTINGLAIGDAVMLTLNGMPAQSFTLNGIFAFNEQIPAGTTYDVTVASNPSVPVAESCVVIGGTGTATGNVTSIVVNCTTVSTTDASTDSPTVFTISGVASGCGTTQSISVQLTTPQLSQMVMVACGTPTPFTFGGIPNGTTYTVSAVAPVGLTCIVNPSMGVIQGADVTNIAVDCGQAIDGTLSGLIGGETVTLELNDGDDLPLSMDGAFAFTQPIPVGQTYRVSVATQPSTEICTVTGGSGMASGGGAAVNVLVNCVPAYVITVTYTVTQVSVPNATTITLSDNVAGGQATIQGSPSPGTSSGNAEFPPVPVSSHYAITLVSPSFCTITAGTNLSGVVAGPVVATVAITCTSFTGGGDGGAATADSGP